MIAGYHYDAVPHKFTGKERDSESGLDNFGARYNSSSMGRFTRPDPIMFSKQKLLDPQQWNMYSYARNNPLRFLDPTGLYVCNGTKAQCAKIEDALAKAREAANSKDLSAKERAAIKRVTDFYGKANDDSDGVTVSFAKLKPSEGGNEHSYKEDAMLKTDITINSDKLTKLTTPEIAGIVVHEGEHGIEGAAMGGRDPESRKEELTGERHAYNLQSYVLEGLGAKDNWNFLWDPAWAPEYAQGNRYTSVLRGALGSTAQFCRDDPEVPGC